MRTPTDTLRAFGPSTLVVRAVGVLVSVMQPERPLVAYNELQDVMRAAKAPESLLEAVTTLAIDATACRIHEVGTAVDGADRALARRCTPGGDHVDEQAEDAVMKLLMIGWLARYLHGDGVTFDQLCSLPTAAALVDVWAAADVALPLGGGDLAGMLRLHGEAQATKLVAMLDEQVMDGVQSVLPTLLPRLQARVDVAMGRVTQVTEELAPFVPGLIADAAGAAESIAIQTDRLPIYKWLTARLAVEHAVRRAVRPEG